MKGILRLRCRGVDNLYAWEPRRFALDEGAVKLLSSAVEDDGQAPEEHDIRGARFARPWGEDGGGAGFDIVWPLRDSWKFLCGDAIATIQWVRHINEALRAFHARQEAAPGAPGGGLPRGGRPAEAGGRGAEMLPPPRGAFAPASGLRDASGFIDPPTGVLTPIGAAPPGVSELSSLAAQTADLLRKHGDFASAPPSVPSSISPSAHSSPASALSIPDGTARRPPPPMPRIADPVARVDERASAPVPPAADPIARINNRVSLAPRAFRAVERRGLLREEERAAHVSAPSGAAPARASSPAEAAPLGAPQDASRGAIAMDASQSAMDASQVVQEMSHTIHVAMSGELKDLLVALRGERQAIEAAAHGMSQSRDAGASRSDASGSVAAALLPSMSDKCSSLEQALREAGEKAAAAEAKYARLEYSSRVSASEAAARAREETERRMLHEAEKAAAKHAKERRKLSVALAEERERRESAEARCAEEVSRARAAVREVEGDARRARIERERVEDTYKERESDMNALRKEVADLRGLVRTGRGPGAAAGAKAAAEGEGAFRAEREALKAKIRALEQRALQAESGFAARAEELRAEMKGVEGEVRKERFEESKRAAQLERQLARERQLRADEAGDALRRQGEDESALRGALAELQRLRSAVQQAMAARDEQRQRQAVVEAELEAMRSDRRVEGAELLELRALCAQFRAERDTERRAAAAAAAKAETAEASLDVAKQEIALLEAELGRRKEAADGLRQKARRLEQLAHAAGAARRTKAAAPPGRPRGVGRRRAVRP